MELAESPPHTQRCADKVETAAHLELRVYCHFYGAHQRELISERQVLGAQSMQPEGWNGPLAEVHASPKQTFKLRDADKDCLNACLSTPIPKWR